MRLVEALRLGSCPRLALVGAGGKTSALFRLGRELLEGDPSKTVLVTTTTHLGIWQLDEADHHIPLSSEKSLADLEAGLKPGLVLVSGSDQEGERITGPGGQLLEAVYNLAERQAVPLLVEADGARQRPLKAPAQHEPVIPDWVDTVAVVAGLTALGQPLAEASVHRPELFAMLSGLWLGQTITVRALGRVLVHPEGGLKGIPDSARRVALLNQAETPERQAQAQRLAGRLLPQFQAILVASLAAKMERPPGPIQAPDFSFIRIGVQSPPVYAVHEPAAAVILAAGGALRLGQPKQVLPWRGQPLVRHVASTALAAGLSPVVVVCGAAADEVQAALAGLPVELVFNPDWRAGQGTSVAEGVRRLPAHSGSVVFLLADQPQIPPGLVRSLVELHAATLAPVVAPQVLGQRANPVLFDKVTFPDLQRLAGEMGGRSLFGRFRPLWLPWHDGNLLLDVDTPEDYQRLLDME